MSLFFLKANQQSFRRGFSHPLLACFLCPFKGSASATFKGEGNEVKASGEGEGTCVHGMEVVRCGFPNVQRVRAYYMIGTG